MNMTISVVKRTAENVARDKAITKGNKPDQIVPRPGKACRICDYDRVYRGTRVCAFCGA